MPVTWTALCRLVDSEWLQGKECPREREGKEDCDHLGPLSRCLLFPLPPWSSHIPKWRNLVCQFWAQGLPGLSSPEVSLGGQSWLTQGTACPIPAPLNSKCLLGWPSDLRGQSHTWWADVPFAKYATALSRSLQWNLTPGARLSPFPEPGSCLVRSHYLLEAQPLPPLRRAMTAICISMSLYYYITIFRL